MAVLVTSAQKVILQGVTTDAGKSILSDYAKRNIQLVGAISVGDGGGWSQDGKIPFFDSVKTAMSAVNPDISLIAADKKECINAIHEAAGGGISLIICHTKDVPKQDLTKIKSIIKDSGFDSHLLGPGSFGIMAPGEVVMGRFPTIDVKKGRIGIISTSSYISCEIVTLLSENGFGISTAIDAGNVNGVGMNMVELLKLYDQDPETEKVIIASSANQFIDAKTIDYMMSHFSKPLVIYHPGIKRPTAIVENCVGKIESILIQRFEDNLKMVSRSGITCAENIKNLVNYLSY